MKRQALEVPVSADLPARKIAEICAQHTNSTHEVFARIESVDGHCVVTLVREPVECLPPDWMRRRA